MGIIAAFVFMGAILAVCAIKRRSITNGVIVAVSVLFAVGIPFLLPHMHDRYFFAADVLTVVMAYAYRSTPLPRRSRSSRPCSATMPI